MSIETLKQAYLAGFMASGEGYNAEWPFGDKNQNPENDPAWCRNRDSTLRTAIEQMEKQEPIGKLCVLSDGMSERGWSYDISTDYEGHSRLRDLDGALLYTQSPTAAPVQEPVEVDSEGENMAVRSFLMLYGQPGLTVGQMKKHMDMSGHSCCPVWVYTEPEKAHLTKAGAQLWIRHLFALEATPPAAPVQEPSGSFMTREQAIEFCRRRRPGIEPTEQHITATIDAYSALFGDLVPTPPAAQPAQEEIQRLSALVRAQQITIDKLEAQRQWVGLTEDERGGILVTYSDAGLWRLAEAIEAKLREKNTPEQKGQP